MEVAYRNPYLNLKSNLNFVTSNMFLLQNVYMSLCYMLLYVFININILPRNAELLP